jgi:hypothetical protein
MLRDMYISDDLATERRPIVVGVFAYMRGLCVARPTKMGTWQSLILWDEQWFGAPRFFSILSICPTAGVSVEHLKHHASLWQIHHLLNKNCFPERFYLLR